MDVLQGLGVGSPGLGVQLGGDGCCSPLHTRLCCSPGGCFALSFAGAAQISTWVCFYVVSRTAVLPAALEMPGLNRLLLLPDVLSSVFRMELLPWIVTGTLVLIFILKLSSVFFSEFYNSADIAWPRGTGFIKAFASSSSASWLVCTCLQFIKFPFKWRGKCERQKLFDTFGIIGGVSDA